MPTQWPAPAKINLFLNIVGRRADGYHNLQTVFQFLDLADTITLIPRDDDIRRLNGPPGVLPEQDLMIRAARLLRQHTGVVRGIDISIDKRIPMGGGLGGGSSDAATVLVALNRIWNLGLAVADLAALGLTLGADVPVFVHGHAAFAEGVGELLTPCDPPELEALVVFPECAVATGPIFAQPDLTRDTPPIRMHAFSELGYNNDCEAVVRRLYPEVDRLLRWLGQFGQARLTGTGACGYLLSDDAARLRRIQQQVPERWSSFVTRTLNLSPLAGVAPAG
ncbi:MAG: 4-(cytidine 5'-diphospho)-2-C-methyl-D-erythritol kinase [Gammaproteobacteria bacterium]|nr:4-(cytidine 5'-diphospho)-2-C-methyl-D-erythritol kinase [Gammaproteobacteria bacterium]